MTSLTSIPPVSHGEGLIRYAHIPREEDEEGERGREKPGGSNKEEREEKWAVKRDQSVMKCLRSDKKRGHAEGKGNGEVPCIVIISFSAALPLKVGRPFSPPRAQHHSLPKQTVCVKETTHSVCSGSPSLNNSLFWLKLHEKLTNHQPKPEALTWQLPKSKAQTLTVHVSRWVSQTKNSSNNCFRLWGISVWF